MLFISSNTNVIEKGPKLGKRAQALLKKQEDTSFSKEPISSEDYLELGSADEESGDRWLGSDLSKSLRFYQKAYTNYLHSIQLDKVNLDSYYNSSRLLFQVYSQYFKTDGVNVYDLVNVNDVLTNDESSVFQDLTAILHAHEDALEVARKLNVPIPLDLIFNSGIVLTEVLEVEQDNVNSNFNRLLEITHTAQEMFKKLLDLQVNEFQKFLGELEAIPEGKLDVNQPNQDISLSAKQEEYTSEEVVQPTDILETVLASYKVAQAILENITDYSTQIQPVLDLINPFLSICDEISRDLIENFSETSPHDMVSNISLEQIGELKIIKTNILGLLMNDLNQLFDLWSSDNIPKSAERFMLAADNIQSLLDRNDYTLSSINATPTDHKDLYWKALTEMNNALKQAQNILHQSYLEKKKTPSGKDIGLGSLIAQISEVMIARADVDLQRCQVVGYEPSEKNKQVLLQNSKTLLKNAMTLANTPGGLRERVAEKLQREKKKVDAVLRMCVLEGKSTIDELDTILGRNKWINELPTLKRLAYFEQFGINNIEVPPF